MQVGVHTTWIIILPQYKNEDVRNGCYMTLIRTDIIWIIILLSHTNKEVVNERKWCKLWSKQYRLSNYNSTRSETSVNDASQWWCRKHHQFNYYQHVKNEEVRNRHKWWCSTDYHIATCNSVQVHFIRELYNRHEIESLGKNLKMCKNGQKCLKNLKISRMGHKKNLNSGLYLKILMPDINTYPLCYITSGHMCTISPACRRLTHSP